MNATSLPRIAAVSAASGLTLHVRWQSGGESTIDESRPVNIYRLYQPLRDNPALFGQVRVGEYGADVTWTDWVDMSADMLWHLAAEQRTAPTLALQTGN